MSQLVVVPDRFASRCRFDDVSLQTSPAGTRVMPTSLPELAVTRLAPGRWLAVSRSKGACGRQLYLSSAEDGLIRAVRHEAWLDVRIEGRLGADGTANLGDCLVAALDQGVARIGLELSDPDRKQPAAMEALLESLARHAVGQDGRPSLAVAGDGVGAKALALAIGRGLASRNCRPRFRRGRP